MFWKFLVLLWKIPNVKICLCCIIQQIDTEYRKVWDKYAAKLDIIERDPEGDSEVLHWIMKYPVSYDVQCCFSFVVNMARLESRV